MDSIAIHQKMIYPCVRIRTPKVGGSGTVIHSKLDDKSGEYRTFVLTNHHVVESVIVIKDAWDSLLKRNVKKDFLEEVTVESFDYHNLSTIVSANAHQAEIVAYDAEHDLAVLHVLSPRQFPHVATLIPEDKIKELYLTKRVRCVGCSLLHDPIITAGEITGIREVIERKTYILQSAHSVFGNSGGALYTEEEGWLLGVPSRITAIQLGFGVDILTWMGFAASPSRLYDFCREQELQFLYDPKDDYDTAMKRREAKREQERYRLAGREERGAEETA